MLYDYLFRSPCLPYSATPLNGYDKGKALVDVLVPALATVGTDDTKKVYTKTEAGNTFLKTADLGTKVAEKAVVDVLVPALATVGTDDTKKVYTKTEAGSTFLKTADLATKVAEKAVVDVLVPALATGADDKGIYTKKGVDDALVSKADTAALANKLNVDGNNISDAFVTALTTGGTNDNRVYTKTAANTALTDKVNVSGNNATEAGVNAMLSKLTDKVVQTSQLETLAVAGKVLGVKDGNKSILVDKLGGFLDNSTDNQYGAQSNQTAKEFLTGKGMKPTAAEIAADPALQQHVAKISLQSPEFKKAVQEEMSQQYSSFHRSPDMIR